MAGAIARGLIKCGHPKERIIMSNRSPEKLTALANELGIKTTLDNQAVCTAANVVLLAVKPQMMREALANIDFASVDCVISVAAGLATDSLAAYTHHQVEVIRSMPNTPSIEMCGATGLYAKPETQDRYGHFANYVFGAVGEYQWVEDEALMDTVTALAGSSPAYFFRFMETLISAGIAQGMPEQAARNLVVQSALGAATLIKNHPDIAISERRKQVTSPNGTTAAALDSLEQSGIAAMADKAVKAAVKRGKELSQS